MQVPLALLLAALAAVSCQLDREKRSRRKNDYADKSLWKKEYENELTDAMLASKKRENITRVAQSVGMMDNEAVVDKLMESITSSEKYLKKVDSIDFRLNRLDIEVHEKTNNIMKQLIEIMKLIKNQADSDRLEPLLESIKSEISQLKFSIGKTPRAKPGVQDTIEYQNDSSMDSRMSYLENQIKSVVSGVESILTIISEVKNRQYARVYSKNDLDMVNPNPIDSMSLINEFRRTMHEQKTRRCDCKSGRVDRAERYPTDCHEIQMQGFNISGIYKVKPDDIDPFYVLCDLTTAGGGWTVFQNRFDGSQDFYKGWSDYKHGFGNLAGEFWLGLEKLNFLTNQKLYELRIDMETQHGQEAYAGYSVFTVGPEHEGFRISTLGTYYGTAGDSLVYHAGQKFSTLDLDNDEWKDGACATEHGGAWWYKECDKSNLNGRYSTSAEEHQGQSIYWISFKGPNYPLFKTKMMIRPLPASRPVDYGEQSRKISENSKLEKKTLRGMDPKMPYDRNLAGSPYRYDDRSDTDFFHSFT